MDAKKERKKRKKYKSLYLQELNGRKHAQDEANYYKDELRGLRSILGSYFVEMVETPILKKLPREGNPDTTLDPLRYEILASFLDNQQRFVGDSLRIGMSHNLFWRNVQIFRGER